MVLSLNALSMTRLNRSKDTGFRFHVSRLHFLARALKPDLKDPNPTCVSRSLIVLSSDVASRSGCAIEITLRGVLNVKEGSKDGDRVDTFRFAPQTKGARGRRVRALVTETSMWSRATTKQDDDDDDDDQPSPSDRSMSQHNRGRDYVECTRVYDPFR